MSTYTRRLKELPEKNELRPLKSGEQEILETLAFFGKIRGWGEQTRELIQKIDVYLNGAGVPIATTILMLGVVLIFHFAAS